MNSRKKELSATPTGRKENEVLTVSVSYNEGGMNYWNYKQEARGFYLHVGVETREHKNGFMTRCFGIGNSGLKHFIEPAARFNAKRLGAIVPDAAIVETMTARVLEMSAPKEAAQS